MEGILQFTQSLNLQSPFIIAGLGLVVVLVIILIIKNLKNKKHVPDGQETTTFYAGEDSSVDHIAEESEEDYVPSFLESFQLDSTDDLIEEARIYANYGKFEKAIGLLTQFIEQNPLLETGYFELFLIYFNLQNEDACADLLAALPFDKNSMVYANFLANAKMEFPNSRKIWALSTDDVEKINEFEQASDLPSINSLSEIEELKPKLETSREPKAEAMQQASAHKLSQIVANVNTGDAASVKTSAKLQVENESSHLASIDESQEAISPKRAPQLMGQEIIVFEPAAPIAKLDSLEFLTLKSFAKTAHLSPVFQHFSAQFESQWAQSEHMTNEAQKNNAAQAQHWQIMSIANDQVEQVHCPSKEQQIYHQAQALLKQGDFKAAQNHLERELLLHTDYVSLYALLMQVYVELVNLSDYYQFRDQIFNHQQQPDLDIILLISDSEQLLLKKLEKVA